MSPCYTLFTMAQPLMRFVSLTMLLLLLPLPTLSWIHSACFVLRSYIRIWMKFNNTFLQMTTGSKDEWNYKEYLKLSDTFSSIKSQMLSKQRGVCTPLYCSRLKLSLSLSPRLPLSPYNSLVASTEPNSGSTLIW